MSVFDSKPTPEEMERFKSSKGIPVSYNGIKIIPHPSPEITGFMLLAKRDDSMEFYVDVPVIVSDPSPVKEAIQVIAVTLQTAFAALEVDMRMAPRASAIQDKANKFKEGLTK